MGVRLKPGFAAVLVTLLLVVGSSAALCEMSCVLPQHTHGCCVTHTKDGTSQLALSQGCAHAVRFIAAPPVLTTAVTPPVIQALPGLPVSMATPRSSRTAVETASPPKFNLRI